MASGGQKRITKELGENTEDPPAGITVQLKDESSLYQWDVTVEGPEQSPYDGGVFKVLVKFPTDYPFKPPVVSFQTKIYHMNVSNDDKGSMCLGILRTDSWKPPNKIRAVLEMVRNLLIEPNVDDAVETAIAEQYKTNRKEYDKTVREWTKKYAKK